MDAMTDLVKTIMMIAVFVLPVALLGMAIVCFGHCVSDMLDDPEPAANPAEQSRSKLGI